MPQRRIEDISEPYPLGRRVALSESYPEVAAFWCFKKNCGFGPEDFSAGSQVKAWWICVNNKSHIFQQTIKHRIKSERDGTEFHGCIFCRGLRAAPSNSLAKYPEIAKEWLTERNGLSPDEVVAKGATLGWWRCSICQNEWETKVLNRTVKGSGCHYCAGQLVNESNSLASLFPEIAAQWHKTKNGRMTPDKVTCGSPTNFWWRCPKNSRHIWEASPYARTNGRGCQKCALAPYKMTPDKVKLARKLLRENKTFEEVAAILEVHKTSIHRAFKRS